MLLGISMLPGLVSITFQRPAVHPLGQQYALLFSMDTNTVSVTVSSIRSSEDFFAQQYHMQALTFVPSTCTDVFRI